MIGETFIAGRNSSINLPENVRKMIAVPLIPGANVLCFIPITILYLVDEQLGQPDLIKELCC